VGKGGRGVAWLAQNTFRRAHAVGICGAAGPLGHGGM